MFSFTGFYRNTWFCQAHDAPRAKMWLETFGTDTLPIVSPLPMIGMVGGVANVPYYLLDIERLSREQYDAMLQGIAKVFNTDIEIVRAQVARDGMPILMDNTLVFDGDQNLN